MIPKMLNAINSAKYLGISKSTFLNEVKKGYIRRHKTPAHNGVPRKTPTYLISDLDQYIERFLDYEDTAKFFMPGNIRIDEAKARGGKVIEIKSKMQDQG